MSQIKVEEQIGGVVITPKGQFVGGEETDELKNVLNQFGDKDNARVVLNLKDVSYLNSTALGVLISAHAHYVKKGGKIVLSQVGKSLENIFVITKLTLVFEIAETLEDAIKLISK
jgi:anti-sigma B factor antagonist